MIKVIQKEFIITLDQLSKYYQKTDKSLWPEKLKKGLINLYFNNVS